VYQRSGRCTTPLGRESSPNEGSQMQKPVHVVVPDGSPLLVSMDVKITEEKRSNELVKRREQKSRCELERAA